MIPAEIGRLLKLSAWGHGYVADAIGLLTACARETLRLARLAADADPAMRGRGACS